MTLAAKRKASRRKQAPTLPLPPPTFVDIGKTVEVTVRKASAETVDLTLSDGTVLQVRPVVMNVVRSKEKFNPLGEPIYNVNIGMVIHTKVPPRLRRKKK